jgi:hypothetical protein
MYSCNNICVYTNMSKHTNYISKTVLGISNTIIKWGKCLHLWSMGGWEKHSSKTNKDICERKLGYLIRGVCLFVLGFVHFSQRGQRTDLLKGSFGLRTKMREWSPLISRARISQLNIEQLQDLEVYVNLMSLIQHLWREWKKRQE